MNTMNIHNVASVTLSETTITPSERMDSGVPLIIKRITIENLDGSRFEISCFADEDDQHIPVNLD